MADRDYLGRATGEGDSPEQRKAVESEQEAGQEAGQQSGEQQDQDDQPEK